MGSFNLLVSYLFLVSKARQPGEDKMFQVETKTVNLDEVSISDGQTEETPMLEKGKDNE